MQGDEAEDGEKPTHRGRGATLGFGLGLRGQGARVETHSIGSAREHALRSSKGVDSSSRFPKEVLKTGRAARKIAGGGQPTRAAPLLARMSCAGVYALCFTHETRESLE